MHKYSDKICKIVKNKKFLKQPFPLLQVIYQSRFAKKIKIFWEIKPEKRDHLTSYESFR